MEMLNGLVKRRGLDSQRSHIVQLRGGGVRRPATVGKVRIFILAFTTPTEVLSSEDGSEKTERART